MYYSCNICSHDLVQPWFVDTGVQVRGEAHTPSHHSLQRPAQEASADNPGGIYYRQGSLCLHILPIAVGADALCIRPVLRVSQMTLLEAYISLQPRQSSYSNRVVPVTSPTRPSSLVLVTQCHCRFCCRLCSQSRHPCGVHHPAASKSLQPVQNITRHQPSCC